MTESVPTTRGTDATDALSSAHTDPATGTTDAPRSTHAAPGVDATDARPSAHTARATGAPTPVIAVVPLRDGVSGKSRLATTLDPATRRRLVAELARHVVAVLATAPEVAETVVVTADVGFVEASLGGTEASMRAAAPSTTSVGAPEPPRAPEPETAQPAALRILEQPAERPGLNAALEHARDDVRRRHPGATLLVAHADLPSLSVADVAALVAAGRATARELGGGPAVIATDRHDTGTNLLLLPADAAFTFRFGPGSKDAHVAEAARRGLSPVVVSRPGTAADLDTLDDWSELPAETRQRLGGPGASRTAAGQDPG